MQFRGTLEDIFCELSMSSSKINASPKSAITADLVTIGDSWLDLMIGKSIIEPMEMAEDHDWIKGLTEKWKVMACFIWNSVVALFSKILKENYMLSSCSLHSLLVLCLSNAVFTFPNNFRI